MVRINLMESDRGFFVGSVAPGETPIFRTYTKEEVDAAAKESENSGKSNLSEVFK